MSGVADRRWQMTEIADRPLTQASQWFEAWFDSAHYHKLYGYRDAAEASEFVDELIRRLQPRAAAAMLDLGCGTGRHSRHLASKGFRVTGIDLAARSIAEARRYARPGLRFVRGDMRRPFGRNRFDYAFSFFTSFGYFDNPSEHLTVVQNIARSLKPGGSLVLDYLNSHRAALHLNREETRHVDGATYQITRWASPDHFFKRIVIEGGSSAGAPMEYLERVAKFTLRDFERMFSRSGLAIEAVHGDYRLNWFDAARSPRLILVARKVNEADKRVLLPRQVLANSAERFGRQAEV
jgi:SAM-dependent methyltransferase